jgi:hypothetical protein
MMKKKAVVAAAAPKKPASDKPSAAKKPRAKKVVEDDGLSLSQRYGHLGDPLEDDSQEEAKWVRAKMAKFDHAPEPTPLQAAMESLFGGDLTPAASAPTAPTTKSLNFDAPLRRCLDVIVFGGTFATLDIKEGTTTFVHDAKQLTDALFARIDTLLSSNPELARFHDALRKHPKSLRIERAPDGMAGKKWLDVCRGSAHSVPVNADYCIMSIDTLSLAIPRPIAHLLGICHAVYHLIPYLSLVVGESISPEATYPAPLDALWRTLCTEEWAAKPVSEWKWPGSPPFVQRAVHLRAAVEAAQGWIKVIV